MKRSDLGRRLLAVAAAVAAAAAAAPPDPPAPELAAAPGTLVRWGGEGVEGCGMEGREWPPLEGVCFYPIDLLRREGTLEVERVRAGRREEARVRVGPYPYPVQEITIADDSQVHLSAADLARVRREQKEVAALWGLRGPARFTLPLHPPLALLPDGGRFGARRILNGEPRSPHSGADYPAAAGTPVLAAADARVALAADHFFSGKSLFLDHGDGLVSMYFHLREVAVAPGEEVAAGQRIGAVGATGRATGPHLHFALRWRGARIDPAFLLGPPEAVPALGP